jgi:hypothetical protein
MACTTIKLMMALRVGVGNGLKDVSSHLIFDKNVKLIGCKYTQPMIVDNFLEIF